MATRTRKPADDDMPEDPALDVDEAPAEVAPDEKPKATRGGKDIVRSTFAAWWCPYCDTANPPNFEDHCGGCGRKRRGDKVLA